MTIDFNVIEQELQQEALEHLTANVKGEYGSLTRRLEVLKRDEANCDKDYKESIALVEAKITKLKAVTDKDSYVEWQQKVKHADSVTAWDTTAEA